jgi:hypothetical protein
MQTQIDLDATVLVAQRSSKKLYHLPNDDGEPVCGSYLRIDPKATEQEANRSWMEKTPRMIPHHEICALCGDRVA